MKRYLVEKRLVGALSIFYAILAFVLLLAPQRAEAYDSLKLCNRGTDTVYFATLRITDELFKHNAKIEGVYKINRGRCVEENYGGGGIFNSNRQYREAYLYFFQKDTDGDLANITLQSDRPLTPKTSPYWTICIPLNNSSQPIGFKEESWGTGTPALLEKYTPPCPAGFAEAEGSVWYGLGRRRDVTLDINLAYDLRKQNRSYAALAKDRKAADDLKRSLEEAARQRQQNAELRSYLIWGVGALIGLILLFGLIRRLFFRRTGSKANNRSTRDRPSAFRWLARMLGVVFKGLSKLLWFLAVIAVVGWVGLMSATYFTQSPLLGWSPPDADSFSDFWLIYIVLPLAALAFFRRPIWIALSTGLGAYFIAISRQVGKMCTPDETALVVCGDFQRYMALSGGENGFYGLAVFASLLVGFVFSPIVKRRFSPARFGGPFKSQFWKRLFENIWGIAAIGWGLWIGFIQVLWPVWWVEDLNFPEAIATISPILYWLLPVVTGYIFLRLPVSTALAAIGIGVLFGTNGFGLEYDCKSYSSEIRARIWDENLSEACHRYKLVTEFFIAQPLLTLAGGASVVLGLAYLVIRLVRFLIRWPLKLLRLLAAPFVFILGPFFRFIWRSKLLLLIMLIGASGVVGWYVLDQRDNATRAPSLTLRDQVLLLIGEYDQQTKEWSKVPEYRRQYGRCRSYETGCRRDIEQKCRILLIDHSSNKIEAGLLKNRIEIRAGEVGWGEASEKREEAFYMLIDLIDDYERRERSSDYKWCQGITED